MVKGGRLPPSRTRVATRPRRPPNTRSDRFGQHGIRNFTTSSIGTASARGAAASRYGQPTEQSKLSTLLLLRKGQLNRHTSGTTYHANTSHYHTKHRTGGRWHCGRVARWTNTPARISRIRTHPPFQSYYIYRRGEALWERVEAGSGLLGAASSESAAGSGRLRACGC